MKADRALKGDLWHTNSLSGIAITELQNHACPRFMLNDMCRRGYSMNFIAKSLG